MKLCIGHYALRERAYFKTGKRRSRMSKRRIENEGQTRRERNRNIVKKKREQKEEERKLVIFLVQENNHQDNVKTERARGRQREGKRGNKRE